MITVRVGRIPGGISAVQVAEGSTIAQALAAANLSLNTGEIVRMNTDEVPSASIGTTVVSDNAMILLAKQVKGN